MVLALENLSCSKVSSLLHSSVVMNLKVIPCNWVCFVPTDTSTLQVLEYSASCDFRTKAVQVVVSHQRNMCDVKGYVTALYDGAWWAACVTGTNPEMQEVTLSFLHPRGPSRSFLYPHKADILTVHISDILTFVEPTTYPGRTYTLTDKWTEQHKHFRIASSERVDIFTCVCMYGREWTGEMYPLYYVKSDVLIAFQNINLCG